MMTLAQLLKSGQALSPVRIRALLTSLAGEPPPAGRPDASEAWPDMVELRVAPDLTERAVFRETSDSDSTDVRVLHVEALRNVAIAMLWGRETEAVNRFPHLRALLLNEWSGSENPASFITRFDTAFDHDELNAPRVGRRAYRTLSIETPAAGFPVTQRGTIGRPSNELIGEPVLDLDEPLVPERSIVTRWIVPFTIAVVLAGLAAYILW